MTSEHVPPWGEDDNWATFLETAELVKSLEYGPEAADFQKHLDELLWRHWTIAFAVMYALRFAKGSTLVECGVGEGVSAFFALREVEGTGDPSKEYEMHLYDAWSPMREENLLPSESWRIGTYEWLSFDRTKRNLSRFADKVVFHRGHIPEVLSRDAFTKESNIAYLSIDLNSALATKAACEFFFPMLSEGAVVIFDDYGHTAYSDTRRHVDRFLHGQPGLLNKSPTGQAIWFADKR